MTNQSKALCPLLLLALALAMAASCFNPSDQNNDLSTDSKAVDSKTADTKAKDGLAKDSHKPTDANTDAPAEARPPDAPGKDAKKDGPVPDMTPPICPGVDHLVAKGVSTKANTFDLAVDKSGRPHLIYLEAGGALKYVALGPKTTPHTINSSVTVAACAVDTWDRFNVVWADKKNSDRLDHQAMDLAFPGSWSAVGNIWKGKTESVDLDTVSTTLFGAAQGNDGAVPAIYPFTIHPPGTSGYTYSPCGAVTSKDTYGPVRAAMGNQCFGHSAYLKTSSSQAFQVYARASACHQLQDTKVHDVYTPRPIAIACDKSGSYLLYHLAFVAAPTTVGRLLYKLWPKGGIMPGNGEEINLSVIPESVDIALNNSTEPHVSFFTGGTQASVYWGYRVGANNWKRLQISKGAGTETRLRIHKDAKTSATTVHIAYRVGSELKHACKAHKP